MKSKKTKEEEVIPAGTLLCKWEEMTDKKLLKLVADNILPCFKYVEMRGEFDIAFLDAEWEYLKAMPKGINDFLKEKSPYYFKMKDIDAYEKEHPEVLKKPEPETPKEALPPYLDGNNEHFAPELALAIRLWESIAKGEFDSGKDSLSNFVEKYLKKELPGVKTSREMIERFSTMISKQPKSLGKNSIEAVKGKFTPL